jgi:hypothetical protein
LDTSVTLLVSSLKVFCVSAFNDDATELIYPADTIAMTSATADMISPARVITLMSFQLASKDL